MTPERLRQLTALYRAYCVAVKEVDAEFERLYGPQTGPPDRWVWQWWGEMLEGRPEWLAMQEVDAAMTVCERVELAEMAGAKPGRLEELMWVLAYRRVQ